MKISDYITILLVVGIIFFVIALMVTEAKDKYDVDMNTSTWENQYDYATTVNESIGPLQEDLDKLSNQETGWLTKIGAGFTGIISAVTLLPNLMWSGFYMGGLLITGIFSSIGVPAYIIGVFTIMLTVWGIIKLIEFLQRWNI